LFQLLPDKSIDLPCEGLLLVFKDHHHKSSSRDSSASPFNLTGLPFVKLVPARSTTAGGKRQERTGFAGRERVDGAAIKHAPVPSS
jgi:hypothetical protein